jgi:hypothetical protein
LPRIAQIAGLAPGFLYSSHKSQAWHRFFLEGLTPVSLVALVSLVATPDLPKLVGKKIGLQETVRPILYEVI